MHIETLLKTNKALSAPNKQDVVLKSSVKIYRNIDKTPFHPILTDDYTVLKQLPGKIHKVLKQTKSFNIQTISPEALQCIIDNDIIPGDFFIGTEGTILYNNRINLRILLNGTDHILILLDQSGSCLEELYRSADLIDNDINSVYEYAYTEKNGYLTSDLEKSGTGLSVKVLVHLPVLSYIKSINEISKVAEAHGTVIKPFVSHSKNNYGDLYIVNNKYSFGKSEYDIVDLTNGYISIITDMEREARDNYYQDYRSIIDDRIGRSFGILTHASQLNNNEALEYLSNMRLGIILSRIKKISLEDMTEMLYLISQNSILYRNPVERLDEIGIYTQRAKSIQSYIRRKGGQLA